MEATGDGCQAEQVVIRVPLVVIEHDYLVLEHLLQVLLRVEVEPVLEAEPAELVVHLLLLEEVDLLRLLLVSFLVQADEFEEHILADLLHGLGHEDFAAELGMHRQEWRAIKLLERGDKHDLDVLDRQYIEMPQVEFGRAPVDEKLPIDCLEECRAVRCLYLWQLGKSLALWWCILLICLRVLACGTQREVCSREHVWVDLRFLLDTCGCCLYRRGLGVLCVLVGLLAVDLVGLAQ